MQSQIHNTQSQGQNIHAYVHPANTDRSYNIEKEEKLKYLWDIQYYVRQNKIKNQNVYFMEWTIHNWTFQKQMTETTQMQSTNLQHSISRSIYSCVLTPCKYRSIIQYWNRGKIKISVRHPHTMCNKTKPKIKMCILWNEQYTT